MPSPPADGFAARDPHLKPTSVLSDTRAPVVPAPNPTAMVDDEKSAKRQRLHESEFGSEPETSSDESVGDSRQKKSNDRNGENGNNVQATAIENLLNQASSSIGRRSHLKSRNGCLICKRRKIKCDEMRPQCRNCVRHNVICSFAGGEVVPTSPAPSTPSLTHASPSSNPMHQPFSASTTPSSTSTSSYHRPPQMPVSIPVPGVLPGLATRFFAGGVTANSSFAAGLSARSSATTFSTPPSFDTASNAGASRNANGEAPNLTAIPSPHTVLGQPFGSAIATQQLSLLTNYILNTSKSLSNNFNPRSVYMWTHEVPAMACEFDFMMYSILALSATHLQYLRNDLSYENIAVYYRHRAIESFRNNIASDVSEKTPTMLEALIIAGSLVSVDAFAYVETGEYSNNRAVSLDRWLPLLLGIKAVVIESDQMNEGHTSLHWNPHIYFLPVGERSLLYLSNLIDKRATELNQRELTYMCERPVRVLEQLITFNDTEFVELGAGLIRYIMTWPFVCSDEFIQKLKNYELVPLAIYVHYLAVMSFTKVWWQDLRVKNDVRMICKILGRDWEPWLEWPRAYFDFNLWEDD
ncbi:uncharacterized protein V2V93DRAFT_363837 [Kockiozyma suomiensis]|uniref:uncharacterized protein n=1 Tax=Kockiozyma suomiensis TaxID=1337062 RepID=UPI003343920B